MSRPIDLRLEGMSMTSSSESNGLNESHPSQRSKESAIARKHSMRRSSNRISNKPAPKDTFWRRQMTTFKKTVGVSGSFYNMGLASLVTFIGVFLILIIFRVPFVMTTPKPTPSDPDPAPCLNVVSALIWALVMSVVVFGISFLTRPKAAPAYVLEK